MALKPMHLKFTPLLVVFPREIDLWNVKKGHGAPENRSNEWNISPEIETTPRIETGPRPHVSLKEINKEAEPEQHYVNGLGNSIQLENIVIEHSKLQHKLLTDDNVTADDMRSVNIFESKHRFSMDQDELIAMHGPKYNVTQLDRFPETTNPKVQEALAQQGEYIYRKEFTQFGGLPYLPPIKLETNCVYMGQWKDGKKHGKGKQLMEDGAIYEGYWENDKGNKRGRIIHTDGDVYDGEFLDDAAHGKGRFVHLNGSFYFGPWIDNEQCGLGTEENITLDCDEELIKSGKNINKYEGNFKKGNRDGNGRYF